MPATASSPTAWPGALVRRPTTQLLLTSLLGLYVELLCIRWMPAHVRYLSYFSNFILLASFLGLGVGILTAKRSLPLGPRLFPWFMLAVAVLVARTKFELAMVSLGCAEMGYAVADAGGRRRAGGAIGVRARGSPGPGGTEPGGSSIAAWGVAVG